MKEIHVIRTGFLSVNTLIVPCGSKKCFVVDPAACKMSGDENKIVSYLKEKKLDCVAIILTHSHFDHITGILQIKNAFPKAKIAIHTNEFAEMQNLPGPMNQSVLRMFGMTDIFETLSNQPIAEKSLASNCKLSSIFQNESQENEELLAELDKWIVIHTPGHTPGSICLYNGQEKILISGDTLFDGGYGRTDMMGGNEAELVKSLNFLQENIPQGTLVYPGHDNFAFSL